MSQTQPVMPVPDAAGEIDVNGVMAMLPHRYPLLMVEKLTELVPGESAVGIKNVSINEPYFQGHFPTRPVMPGVLIIETMAQTAAALVVFTLGPKALGKLVYFMSVDGARFRHPVVPGDQLRVHVQKQRNRGGVWKFEGKAHVGDRLCADAVFTAMIVDS